MTLRSNEELAQLGPDVFARLVRPQLRSEDDDKYVAVDVDSAEFEIDSDDHAAVMRLRRRLPGADIWLERAGWPAAYKIRRAFEVHAAMRRC